MSILFSFPSSPVINNRPFFPVRSEKGEKGYVTEPNPVRSFFPLHARCIPIPLFLTARVQPKFHPTPHMTPGERFVEVVRAMMRRSKSIVPRAGGHTCPHVPSAPKRRFMDIVNSVIRRQRAVKENERRRALNASSTIGGVTIRQVA